MKHIKTFNESNIQDDWVNSIKEFCEINLAYLIDDGLTVNVRVHYTNEKQEKEWDRTKLCDVMLEYKRNDFKKWDSIKDNIIPFFIRLSRHFNVPSFDHLPRITSDRIPETLRGHQVQFGLIGRGGVLPAVVPASTYFRRNFSINDRVLMLF